jgi:plastocyanin
VLAKTLIVLALAIPLAVAACGGDDDDETTAPATTETTAEETTASGGGGGAGGTIDISETEFRIDPADPTVSAGTVTFNISNDGAIVHNLEVEGNGVEEVSDDFQPGQSGKLTVDLDPGTYELYCAIGDHAEQGMEGTLTVE